MRHLHFSFYQKYATRISVCVIAVSKSQEFLLKVHRLYFFPPRRKGFDFDDESMFFSTTSDTNRAGTTAVLPRLFGEKVDSWIQCQWQYYAYTACTLSRFCNVLCQIACTECRPRCGLAYCYRRPYVPCVCVCVFVGISEHWVERKRAI